MICCSNAASAETRGYVIYYLHTATHGAEQNCPNGTNGDFGAIKRRAFDLHGFSQEKIDRILAGEISPQGAEMFKITSMRGKRNGKPANVFHYPTSAPDPQENMVVGPYAYGFNLDGKDTNGFEDPETGQQGVDNELYRVVGCYKGYNESLPVRPNYERQVWTLWGHNMPAWLITISAEDFGRDGDATVSFHKAIEPRRQDALGNSLVNATYVVDPDPRNRAIFRGKLKNGTFTSIPNDTHFFLTGDPSAYGTPAKMELFQAQLRLNLNDAGAATGYVGGYQPWLDYWAVHIIEQSDIDVVALYYGLRRMADARPDPDTGENTAISVAYRLDSVPAFIARSDGTLLTDSH